MALGDILSSSPPYSSQLQNIAGATTNLGGLYALNANPAAQAQTAGTLQSLGQQFTGQAQPLLSTGVTTEESGQLPASAQALISTNLNNTIQQIRGKYASLGMSGSTAEQSEIDAANNQSLASQFALAQNLGGQEVQQSLNLNQLGLSAYQYSEQDLSSIANTALSAFGLSSNMYQNLAQTQLQSDRDLTSAIGSLMGGLGSLGGKGGLPALAGMFSSPAAGVALAA